jgi:hypothetical protein
LSRLRKLVTIDVRCDEIVGMAASLPNDRAGIERVKRDYS